MRPKLGLIGYSSFAAINNEIVPKATKFNFGGLLYSERAARYLSAILMARCKVSTLYSFFK